MYWRVVVGNLGTMLRLFSIPLLVPLVLGFVFEPRTTPTPLGIDVPDTFFAFAVTALGSFVAGLLLSGVGTPSDFRDKEAYVLVGIGWISCTLIAAVPYALTDTLGPVDAFFEAMSGLTTTGATIIDGPLELVAPSVHVWRALTQWIGGMGIVVLSVAVLARLASAGARLMQAELPGGKVDRMRPSIKQTARSLWKVYSSLSLALFLVLLVLFWRETGGFRRALLDAMVHTFTTLSTGGFSTRTNSIQAYDAPLVELTIVVFMVLAGTNFALTYRAVRGRPGALFSDTEFRFYLSVLGAGTVVLAGVLLLSPYVAAGATGPDYGFWRALLASLFQAVSIITTTGYTTANYDQWPELARFLLLFFMFVGGCAGSTSGSIKIVRVFVLFKVLRAELRRIAHPRAVLPIRLGREIIDSLTLQRVIVFVFAYLTAFIGGTVVILALEPVTVLDAASAVAACIGNVGPALGAFGPAENYSSLGDAGTIVLALLMWFGRLELFAVLVLFSPGTYE